MVVAVITLAVLFDLDFGRHERRAVLRALRLDVIAHLEIRERHVLVAMADRRRGGGLHRDTRNLEGLCAGIDGRDAALVLALAVVRRRMMLGIDLRRRSVERDGN